MAKKKKSGIEYQKVTKPDGTVEEEPLSNTSSPKIYAGRVPSLKKELELHKENAAELELRIDDAARKGHDFIYMPLQSVKDWKDYTETRAEYTNKVIDKMGEEAQDARIYTMLADLSAYDAIDIYHQGYFKDWSDQSNAEHDDALQKLGGRTPMLTWAIEMLPVYKTYMILKNFYDHATKKKDKEPIKPVVTPEGGMVWDAESYWGFVRFLKENLTEQYIRTLDVVSKTENEDIAEREMKLFNDLGRLYVGLLGGSAIPFTASSPKELKNYVETISKMDKKGMLPEYLETIGAGNKGTGASTKEKPMYTLEGNTLKHDNVPVYIIPRKADGSINKKAIANSEKYMRFAG